MVYVGSSGVYGMHNIMMQVQCRGGPTPCKSPNLLDLRYRILITDFIHSARRCYLMDIEEFPHRGFNGSCDSHLTFSLKTRSECC